MTRSLVWLLFGLFSLSGFSQETGIRFENLSYDEALARARTSGRYLFIDCYTSWCGPCKQLEKEVFADPEVAEYFNSNFINLRIDVEKGEGPDLKRRFGVQPVPTLLFINAEGTVEHKFIGTLPPDEFIRKSSEVFTDENRYGILNRRYDNGDRSSSFLSGYINELINQSEYSRAREILSQTVAEFTPDSLCLESWWPVFTHGFIAEFGSGYYNYLLRNRPLWINSIGQERYDDTMASLYKRYTATWIFSGASRGDEASLIARAREDIFSLNLDKNPGLTEMTDIALARVKGDYDLFLDLIEKNKDVLPDEDKYVIFIDSRFFSKEASSIQCEKYLAMINRFLDRKENEKYRSRLLSIVQSLESKTKK